MQKKKYLTTPLTRSSARTLHECEQEGIVSYSFPLIEKTACNAFTCSRETDGSK